MDRFLITHPSFYPKIHAILQNAKNLGASKIYIRDETIAKNTLYKIANCALEFDFEIFINHCIFKCDWMKNCHLHLKTSELNLLSNYHKKSFKISCSAHNLAQINIANNANYIFLSPIFATKNKTPLGMEIFSKIPDSLKSKIYALGGINEANLALFKDLNIAGIAGISMFEC